MFANVKNSVICRRLGYQFKTPALLKQALTHRSFGTPHNERLEFLGDSVLNCVIADTLYQQHPRLPEGDLSRLRAHLVNKHTLHEVAQSLNLGEHLLLGEGELKSGGFRRPSILADALEAIFGAIFVDSGFVAAGRVIGALYVPLLQGLDAKRLGKDPKTLLQEYLQGRKIPLPRYAVLATHGEAHQQRFEVECCIPALDIRSHGEGDSRRGAEQNAAKEAYQLATRG
jgi:ribonuclease-3